MYGHRWILLLTFLVPVAFGQGIYKWVDEQGEVHYGEAPPEGSQATPVTVKNEPPVTPAPSQAERDEATQRLLRTYEEERNQKAEQEAKAAKEAGERQRNCMLARDRLRSYREAGSLYGLDKNGERRVYSETEHASALKRAEAEVANWCK